MATLVRITKTSTVPGGAPAASWHAFVPAQSPPAGCSLPVDYTIDGFIIEPVLPGRPIQMLRIARNGVLAIGMFDSSPVVEIRVRTGNSESVITQLKPEGVSKVCG